MSSITALLAQLLGDTDLSARDRAIRAGIGALVVGLAAAALYWAGRGDIADELDLRGVVVTLLLAALGLTRTAQRHSRRPSSPDDELPTEQTSLPREATGTHRLPREATDPRFPLQLDEDDRPTIPGRPPRPALPIDVFSDDEEEDTLP